MKALIQEGVVSNGACFQSSHPICPESKAHVLYAGLGYVALKTSFYGPWNSFLVEYMSIHVVVLTYCTLTCLCCANRNPTMY